ncbi:MAG TPA: HAMP domain-containing sensor histidine kinase [Acidimicrobiales bacterium]|nr:HAMP domain-containing sensor histidine kinase [Acidimicrobiales bacterium]
MKLSTRLTILLMVITALVALAVGTFAVSASSRAQYATLDDSINAVAASGEGHPLTALTNALNLVQQDNLDLTLDVVDPTGAVTQISSSEIPLTVKPTLANVKSSLGSIRTAANLPGFRFRSLPVGGGAYLVIAGSTATIAGHVHQVVIRTVLVGLLAALLIGVLARLAMAGELATIRRLITFATEVAEGDLDDPVPPATGSSDVRELQRALEHMVRSLRATIDAEKRSAVAMQRFIGDASHELRTPLTVITGYAELLAGGQADEEQRQRALERVRKEVARMDVLVADLLFLAEVAEVRGRGETLINASEVVSGAAHDFAIDHPERDVEVNVGEGVTVKGRLDFFERLLNNAFANIARHTEATDPVRISLAREGVRVTLDIDDGGPGMPSDAYGAAPEGFRRFDPSRSRTSGGSGLGMSIMADVAASMNGSLATSRSDLGGLRLHFDFPAGS